MKKIIKIFDPSVGTQERKVIERTFHSHFWSSGLGTGNVSVFEEMFRKYVNSDECVAVNSGSAALHLALSLLDIKNKEVVVPSLTFVSLFGIPGTARGRTDWNSQVTGFCQMIREIHGNPQFPCNSLISTDTNVMYTPVPLNV